MEYRIFNDQGRYYYDGVINEKVLHLVTDRTKARYWTDVEGAELVLKILRKAGYGDFKIAGVYSEEGNKPLKIGPEKNLFTRDEALAILLAMRECENAPLSLAPLLQPHFISIREKLQVTLYPKKVT